MSNQELLKILNKSAGVIFALSIFIGLLYFDRITFSEKSSYRRANINSSIKFIPLEGIENNITAEAFVITDLDSDLFPDLCYIVGSSPIQKIECLLNSKSKSVSVSGVGTTSLNKVNLGIEPAEKAHAIYSFDLDLNGKNDFLILSKNSLQIYYQGEKNLTFEKKFEAAGQFKKIEFFDLNFDNLPDFITTDLNHNLLYFVNSADKNFSNEVLQTEYSDIITSKNKIIDYADLNLILTQFPGSFRVMTDLNNDGTPDYFIGGNVLPPLYSEFNQIWLSNAGKARFEESAVNLGLDRCGITFNGRAVDFDLDTVPELLLSSGMLSKNLKNRYVVKPCLFVKNKEQFSDVGNKVFADFKPSIFNANLSSVDFDSDGLTDLAGIDLDGKVFILKNKTETKNNWLGLVFKNKTGSRIQTTVKGEVLNWRNQRIEYFEFSPMTGGGSQGDFRKVIGLGQNTHATVKIYYDKNLIRMSNYEANKYHEIKID